MTFIHVSIGESVLAIAILQAILPSASVSVSIPPQVHALSVGLAMVPLTFIHLTFVAFPNTVTMFLVHQPVALILFTVSPLVRALSISLSIYKITFVDVAVCVPLVAEPISSVIHPTSLVYST